jgi:hypothetical protein
MNSDPLATTITVLLVGAGATHFFQIGAMQWYARDWDRQNPLPEGPGEIYRALRSGLMFMVMGTGLLVVVNAGRIASGGPLAVSLCALLSAFAGYRLGLGVRPERDQQQSSAYAVSSGAANPRAHAGEYRAVFLHIRCGTVCAQLR